MVTSVVSPPASILARSAGAMSWASWERMVLSGTVWYCLVLSVTVCYCGLASGEHPREISGSDELGELGEDGRWDSGVHPAEERLALRRCEEA